PFGLRDCHEREHLLLVFHAEKTRGRDVTRHRFHIGIRDKLIHCRYLHQLSTPLSADVGTPMRDVKPPLAHDCPFPRTRDVALAASMEPATDARAQSHRVRLTAPLPSESAHRDARG